MNEPMPAEVRSIIQDYLESNATDRQAFRRRFIAPFHTMNVEKRDHLLTDWERLVPGYTLGIECASWGEIRSWEDQGIAVGSHTVNHHRLTLLEPNDIESELRVSRESLLRHLRGEVKSVSYPEGSYTDDVPALAEKAGYEVGFITNPGFVTAPLSGSRRYLIPRISLSGDSAYLASYSIGRLMLMHLAESVKRRLRAGWSPGSRRADAHSWK